MPNLMKLSLSVPHLTTNPLPAQFRLVDNTFCVQMANKTIELDIILMQFIYSIAYCNRPRRFIQEKKKNVHLNDHNSTRTITEV